MEILNINSLSPGVIESIYGLHAKDEYGGEVEDKQQQEYNEHAHPRGEGEVTLAVVGGAEERTVTQ